MRTVAVIATLLMVACAHGSIALDQALRLEVAVGSKEITADNHVRVVSSLRNVSTVPVEFCLLDGGVMLAARVADGVVPLVESGIVLDAPCYGHEKLPPGMATIFDNQVSLWTGTTAITGSIRVHRPGHEAVEIRSVAVPVAAEPPNNGLQPGTAKP
jgi:hypothetical protein